MKRFHYPFTALLFLSLFGCVTSRKFEEQKNLTEKYAAQERDCQEKLEVTSGKLTDMALKLENCQISKDRLVADTAATGIRYRKIERLNGELNQLYDKMIAQNNKLVSNATSEKEALNQELSLKERALSEKQIELDALAEQLKRREHNIKQLEVEVDSREKRIIELEDALSAKESAFADLNSKIRNALTDFSVDELTVTHKDGKIYVSLAENLLFQSGSATVDDKGITAITTLAEVLKKQEDIEIVVEGHTDNVPYKGSGKVQDNWDLSVLRATNVVKILTAENGLAPERVIAAGRGEYLPLGENETKEGRAKNRRTEIIISPDLDKIFEILGSAK